MKLSKHRLAIKKEWERQKTIKIQSKTKIKKIENLDGERWYDIPEYIGLYQLSSLYRIKSICRWVDYKRHRHGKKLLGEQLISLPKNGVKYPHVCLSKKGKKKTELIHRIVAMVFIPNPYNKPEVNHINGDSTNYMVENLEWVTKSENIIHSYSKLGQKALKGERNVLCKLTFEQVKEIRKKYKWREVTHKMLAKEYGVSACRIAFIVTNKARQYE